MNVDGFGSVESIVSLLPAPSSAERRSRSYTKLCQSLAGWGFKHIGNWAVWHGIMHILSSFLGGFPPNSWFSMWQKKEDDVKKGELERHTECFLFEGSIV